MRVFGKSVASFFITARRSSGFTGAASMAARSSASLARL